MSTEVRVPPGPCRPAASTLGGLPGRAGAGLGRDRETDSGWLPAPAPGAATPVCGARWLLRPGADLRAAGQPPRIWRAVLPPGADLLSRPGSRYWLSRSRSHRATARAGG